ncbi:MAG: Na/Pi cotransporter family protein [Lachnospiraceae bacterium]|nr:Na/Pi cotransporter family protein [Lachnospiraceae bacterium]
MGVSMLLSLLCGVALFLFGMTLMGDGLKNVAGNKLEMILYRLSNTPFRAIMLGLAVTGIIQSSSATSVMVVGFVNSGIMKLSQAIGVVMGANIGTSVTGWVLCLSYIEGSGGWTQIFSTTTITAVVAVVGIVFRMFMKKKLHRNIGDVLFGFVILMVGMQMMSGAVSPLKESATFRSMITMFSNPILGILLGIVFSVVLQSASAAIGVLQALSVTGSINFASAFPIVMGISVGASCPVLLSAIGASKNGKRTAFAYLVNDLFGMILCSVLFYGANALVHFSFMEDVMSPVSIAVINSVFRIVFTIFLFPFIKQMEKLLYFLVPVKGEDENETEIFDLLEENFLENPELAIRQSQVVMDGMVKKVRSNLIRSMKLLEEYSEERYSKVHKRENLIDKYEDKLEAYLVRLATGEMDITQSRQVSKILYMVGEFERLADQAVSLADVANELHESNAHFSEEAQKELSELNDAVKNILEVTIEVFSNEDIERAAEVSSMKKNVGSLCNEYKMAHISRIQSGRCNKQSEFVFHEILDEMEHIALYCSNVTVTLIELESQGETE